MGSVKFVQCNDGSIKAIAAPLIITAYEAPYFDWEYGAINKEYSRIHYKDVLSVTYFCGGLLRDAYFSINTPGKTYHAKLIGDFTNLGQLASAIEEGCEVARNESRNSTASVSAADELLKYKELLDKDLLIKVKS